MTIGERIKLIRESEKKNQRDFAASIKISQSTLAMFENGQREVRDIHIEQICMKYRVNEEWLRTGKGQQKKDTHIEFGKMCQDIGMNDPKAREAIAKYYELSPEDKELFWKFTERFMKSKAED